jgi:hypothetical protein
MMPPQRLASKNSSPFFGRAFRTHKKHDFVKFGQNDVIESLVRPHYRPPAACKALHTLLGKFVHTESLEMRNV